MSNEREGVVQRAALPFTEYYLREATWQDCSRLFEWANDPVTRANALSTGSIRWEDHVNWFEWTMGSQIVWLRICCGWYDTPHEGLHGSEVLLGQVRVDNDAGGAPIGRLDYHLAPCWRGYGLGVEMLKTMLAERPLGHEAILAVTKTSNEAACRTVERAGFIRERTYDDLADYVYRFAAGTL